MGSIPRHVTVKSDESDLIELANFFKDTVPDISVKREWFVVFDSNGKYVRSQFSQPKNPSVYYRHPDLMIFPKKFRKEEKVIYEQPRVVFELDGSIHDVKLADTLERNKCYSDAKVPLVVTNKKAIKTSIFDDAYHKIMEILDAK